MEKDPMAHFTLPLAYRGKGKSHTKPPIKTFNEKGSEEKE